MGPDLSPASDSLNESSDYTQGPSEEERRKKKGEAGKYECATKDTDQNGVQ